jgi:hypothetical protein
MIDLSKDQRAPNKCIDYNKEDRNNVISQKPATPVPPIKIPEIKCPAPQDE